MSEEKNPQEKAFSLLTRVCKVKPEALVSAFDNIDSYFVFPKKRDGKKALILKEPKEPLKFVQRRLLQFLYKFKYRADEYNNGIYSEDSYQRKLAYQPILDQLMSPNIHGQVKGRSLQGAIKTHFRKNSMFLIKMDLKEAYPSVKVDVLEKILFDFFITECKAYWYAYQVASDLRKKNKVRRLQIEFNENRTDIVQLVCERIFMEGNVPQKFRGWENKEAYERWGKEVELILIELGFQEILPEKNRFDSSDEMHEFLFARSKPKEVYIINALAAYPLAPLFPSCHFPELRKMIRELVKEGTEIEQSEVYEIIKYFTQYFVQLTTFQGSLPKGAPTSGMLLNLVLMGSKMLSSMNYGSERCSVWVDDFIITAAKKPNKERIDKIIAKIAEAGIFKYNPKKVVVCDLRNRPGSVLGMKLNRRPINRHERFKIESIANTFKPRGFQRAERTGRVFMQLAATLSKEKQNKYRSFLYKVTIKDLLEDEEKDKALGYHGHIVSVYGWETSLMPAKLSKTVQNFRDKFGIVSQKEKIKRIHPRKK